MSGNITLFDAMTTQQTHADVELFDPPMCCPTGLCGPTLDETLLDTNEKILKLKGTGITVERYQMSNQPNAFMSNPDVMRLVREKQMDALPITIVRGKVLKVGGYPTLDEIQAALNKEAIS
jgi:hypothetical protein